MGRSPVSKQDICLFGGFREDAASTISIVADRDVAYSVEPGTQA
jgi:hypothetical protein